MAYALILIDQIDYVVVRDKSRIRRQILVQAFMHNSSHTRTQVVLLQKFHCIKTTKKTKEKIEPCEHKPLCIFHTQFPVKQLRTVV